MVGDVVMTNLTEMMASSSISRPHSGEAFRLTSVDDILEASSATSVSSDKQRIDAMFDESRTSVHGGSLGYIAGCHGSEAATPPKKGMRRAVGRKPSSASSVVDSVVAYGSAAGYGTTPAPIGIGAGPDPSPSPGDYGRTRATFANANGTTTSEQKANAVQMRIEKMFAEISAGGAAGSHCPSAPGSHHRFAVDYLGSVPIADKVTTLQGLQEPLKELYLGYRRVVGSGAGGGGTLWEPGFLDISKEGLKVHHGGRGGRAGGRGRLDQLNPFPTIAVWAAVKLVCRVRADTSAREYEYAFLPLIADPDGIDREALFQVMSREEESAFCTPGCSDTGAPMFAVVMRKVGVSRQLECHAFVCSSSEDAVVMAANLYQALMTSMRAAAGSKASASTPSRRPRMHHENGFGRVSIAGSICGDDVSNLADSAAPPTPEPPAPLQPVPQPQARVPPPAPKRPPRKKKQAPNEPPSHTRPGPPMTASLRGNFSANWRTPLSKPASNSSDSIPAGDILTKVAIPRSRSFLHANGPLMRYGRRGDAALPAPPTVSVSASPLGFNELFAEFRQQEGLESLDDILGAIIDAEGMSFNDLKPIYKEFLLKLALTLTKDELYQRSKHIMHKQRKRQRGENRRRKGFGVAAAHIKRAIRRSLGRLRLRMRRRKPRPPSPKSNPSASAYVNPSAGAHQSSRRMSGVRVSQVVENACNVNVNVSISNGNGNGKSRLPRRRSVARRRSVSRSVSNGYGHGHGHGHGQSSNISAHYRSSTSEESDFFTTIRYDSGVASGPGSGALALEAKNRPKTSSGYVSYSDCGYDSESCTCASAERCYSSHRGCSCDTDSCLGSDKCYCSSHYHSRPRTRPRPRPRPRPPPAPPTSDKYSVGVLEQLKRQGFVASESSLSRAASPSTAWQRNEGQLVASGSAMCAAASAGSVRSSKSLQFVQMWPSRSRSRMDTYRTEERKALLEDREERHASNHSASTLRERRSRHQKKVLVVSARDPKGRVIYMGATCHDQLDQSVAAAAAAAAAAASAAANAKGSCRPAVSMSQFFPRATLNGSERRTSSSSRRRRTSSASAAASATASATASASASTTGDVFSVKKSAEMAALFANVKMSQTTDIVARSTDATATDVSTSTTTYSSLDGCSGPSPDFFSPKMAPAPLRTRAVSSSTAASRVGLETSLGYLP